MSEDKRIFYLDRLSYGHGIYNATQSRQVCEAFNIPFEATLIKHHGATLAGEITGVWDLDLLSYISDRLLIPREEVGYFLGRGFQAQAYVRAIKKKLGLGEKS